jgi:3',5'-cyclic AMP phosphodiesterase CpdA
VLSGHLHVGFYNTHAITAEEGDSLTVLQAGSATSTRLRGEPNAYNRVTVENRRARWTAYHWDGEAWR